MNKLNWEYNFFRSTNDEKGHNMTDKLKGAFLILLLSLSFFMMISVGNIHALGDYLLEYIGLKSWSGEYSGLHLTVLYFGALTIIVLFLVQRHVIEKLGIRWRYVFLSVVMLLTIFTITTNLTVEVIKRSSEGLLAVGFDNHDSQISYRINEGEYTEFNAKISLKNYAKDTKEFFLTIVSPFQDGRHEDFMIFMLAGEPAIFQLASNQTKLLNINLDAYDISGGIKATNATGSGSVRAIILTDMQGNSIRLDSNNYFGIKLNL